MQLRRNLDATATPTARANLDAIREEVEGEVAMFPTFTGGSITSKLDQIIKTSIKS